MSEKRIRQLAPVRVTEGEEIELMRIAARLDRSLCWVRREAYREFILSHGGSVEAEQPEVQQSRASLWDSSKGMTPRATGSSDGIRIINEFE